MKEVKIIMWEGRKQVVPRVGTWVESRPHRCRIAWGAVVPRVGTWVESEIKREVGEHSDVVPRVGTWVER